MMMMVTTITKFKTEFGSEIVNYLCTTCFERCVSLGFSSILRFASSFC